MVLARTLLLAALAVLPGNDPVELGFGILAGFDYEEGMELPEEVTKYDGKRVKVNGFMRREDGDDGPTEYFMLISDACGCDGMPMLNEVIFCEIADAVEIAANTVTVTGTLYVGEEIDDGIVVSIYTLDAESVER